MYLRTTLLMFTRSFRPWLSVKLTKPHPPFPTLISHHSFPSYLHTYFKLLLLFHRPM